MVKQGYKAEVERKKQLEALGFHVTRNSGGIGATDLIAVKCDPWSPSDDDRFFVRYEQVKKTRKGTFYFNFESKDELRRLKELKAKFYIPCFFAIKFTNKGWIILDVNEIDGKPIKFQDNDAQGKKNETDPGFEM